MIVSSIQYTNIAFAILGDFQSMMTIPQILTLNVKSALGFPEEKYHFTLILHERNFNFYFEMDQEASILLESQICFMWQTSYLISF